MFYLVNCRGCMLTVQGNADGIIKLAAMHAAETKHTLNLEVASGMKATYKLTIQPIK